MIDELLQQHRPAICPSMALDCALVECLGSFNCAVANQYLDLVVADRGKLVECGGGVVGFRLSLLASTSAVICLGSTRVIRCE